MAEYAALTARSAGQVIGNVSQNIRMEHVIPILAVAVLVWLLWRTFAPR
jgi:hypothetical protein